jgi:hypothetical protein
VGDEPAPADDPPPCDAPLPADPPPLAAEPLPDDEPLLREDPLDEDPAPESLAPPPPFELACAAADTYVGAGAIEGPVSLRAALCERAGNARAP